MHLGCPLLSHTCWKFSDKYAFVLAFVSSDTNACTSFLNDDDDCVQSGAPGGPQGAMYVWKDSNLETEKEEKIKYVDRDLPVPVAPEIIQVEKIITNVVEVKVRNFLFFFYS